MTKIFTPNDVLNYFYNEVSKLEKEHIEDFLACNEAMRNFYSELLDAESLIEKNLEKPSSKSIDTILKYSKNFCISN